MRSPSGCKTPMCSDAGSRGASLRKGGWECVHRTHRQCLLLEKRKPSMARPRAPSAMIRILQTRKQEQLRSDTTMFWKQEKQEINLISSGHKLSTSKSWNCKLFSSSYFDRVRLCEQPKAGCSFAACGTLSSLSLHSDAALSLPPGLQRPETKSFLKESSSSLSHISFKFLIPQSLKKRERERDAPRQAKLRNSKWIVIRGSITDHAFYFSGWQVHSYNLTSCPHFTLKVIRRPPYISKKASCPPYSIYIDHMQTSLKGEILFWRLKKLHFLKLSS